MIDMLKQMMMEPDGSFILSMFASLIVISIMEYKKDRKQS